MFYKALITVLGLTPAYGASTDTPPILAPQNPSVVKEIPQKVVTFKAQDTVKDIEPKERLTRARYSVQTPLPTPQHVTKKVAKASPKKHKSGNISMTSMQVQDNQEEPNQPQFLNRQPVLDIK